MMIFNIFRLFRFFWPFVADVFKNSEEERRVMIARIVLIAGIAIGGSWLYINDKLDDIDELQAENAQLRVFLTQAEAEKSKYFDQFTDAKGILKTCQFHAEKLEEDRTILETKIQDLKEEIQELTQSKRQIEHSLPTNPPVVVEQKVEKKPTAKAKPVEQKKTEKRDRLSELQ